MFIGKGTSRTAYLNDGVVIKKHDSPVGYMQSYTEKFIYDNVPRKFRKHFNPIYYVTEEYQVSKYCPAYADDDRHIWFDDEELFTMNIYNSDWNDNSNCIAYVNDSQELMDWMWDTCDTNLCELLSSGNFGVTEDNDICFIDYGMTEEMLTILGRGN